MADSVSNDMMNSAPRSEPTRPRLRIGSKLLADAFAGDGTLLLRAGAGVDSDLRLHRLLQPDVTFGPDGSHIMPLDMDNEAVLDESAEPSDPEQFHKHVRRAYLLKTDVVQKVTKVFSRIGSTGTIDVGFAKSMVSALIGDMLDDPRALVSLTQLKDADAYTYTHSVNVGILTIYLAMVAGMHDNLDEIGIGALLHDIGKLTISPRILNKPDKLDAREFKIMRGHPKTGVDLLIKSGGYSQVSLTCVLDHHEKIDGTGYPNGRRSSEIAPYATLTSLADVYDALTTDRPYRKAMNPRDAVMLMTQQMSSGFDPVFLKLFVATVGYFLVGSKVKLSDGSVGVVTRNHRSDPLRPEVELVNEESDNEAKRSGVVDLRKEENIFVSRFIKERKFIPFVCQAA